VGYRIQGLLLRARPDGAGLTALERAFGYRLFELVGRGLWLIDLGIPEPVPGDRAVIRAARPLASGYVDALRVLGNDEETLEQLAWLAASAAAARQLRQPVLGFLSDDEQLDFAAIVKPEGVEVIGDKIGQYLLRWENDTLAIQPFCNDGTNDEPPAPPEELSLIPAVTLLANETLPQGGYPLHGNVAAEMSSFAEGTSALGIGTWNFGAVGSLTLVEAGGLGHSLWDRAAGESGARGR
jgi:hypothetical protein